MNHILNQYFQFLILKTPFCLFGHFSESSSINDSLTIELNYVLNWISRIFLNRIILWIDSWVQQYWIEYLMNHFLAKFKYWIESDWVSATTKWWWWWCCHFDFSSSVTFLQSSYFTPLHRSCQTKLALSRRCHTKARTDSQNLIWKRTQTQIQPTKLHRHTQGCTNCGIRHPGCEEMERE